MDRRLRSVRSFVPVLPLLAAGFLALLPAPAVRGEGPAAVDLFLRGGATGEEADTSLLSPSAAFELRAAVPLVPPDKVGKPAADSPLVLTPPLAGTFRWTSQRGGVFTPSEAPSLGTTYKAALRPGLHDAQGQPVHADFPQTFHTPPLEVRGMPVSYPFDQEPGPEPRLELIFNAAVDPAQAATSLSFRHPGEDPVAVRATRASDKEPPHFGSQVSRQTWRELFAAAHAAPSQTTGQAVPPAAALNRLIVTPSAPLPPGKNWKLVAAAGLSAAESGVRLPAAVEMSAGNVDPFELREVQAINGGEESRKLAVRFSKNLAKDVTAETVGRWVHVSPAPENMKFHVKAMENFVPFNTLEITGNFESDQQYEVTVDAGLPSRGKFYKLAAGTKQTAEFVPETPQIAFTDYSIDQLAAGRRDFAFSARNAAEVRVRAKLIAPDQAAQAQVAYDKSRHDKDGDAVHGKRLDFDRFPGKVVCDKTMTGSTSQDKPATVTLHWDDLLGAHRNGTVLLEVEQPRPTAGHTERAGAQVLVQVTDLGVVWKTSPTNELLAYVFSMADASPVKATVRLLDAAGKPLFTRRGVDGTTRADGVAWVAAGVDRAAWLSVTAGEDCHIVPFTRNRRNSLGLYRFHLPPSAFPPYDSDRDSSEADGDADSDATPAPNAKAAAPKPPRREILLFCERGVYKPGEQAHLKAIVREWRGNHLADVAAGTPATLRAFDAKGRRFWQKDTFLSAAGSLSETVPLPSSPVGHYRVEIAFDGKKAADDTSLDYADEGSGDTADDDDSDDAPPNVCRFQVQEYTPNAFVVKLAKPAASPVGAGPVSVGLNARYYMGKTLSRARTAWSLKAVDTDFAPEGFDDYTFGSGALDNRFNREAGELALDGQAALSDQGLLTLAPQIVLNTVSPGPRRVRLQASVTDQDQQTVTARAAFTVHSSDFYLAVRAMPEVIRAGDPLPLEVVAVGTDAQPRPEPVRYTAKLSRLEWRTNRVANDSGNSDYDSKAEMVPVGTVELTSTGVRRVGATWQPLAEADTLLAAAGCKAADASVAPAATAVAPGSVESLVPREPGEYALVVTAQDGAGRSVQSAVTFDVLGDKEAEWGYKNAWQLPLVADKAEYHSGDRATILLKTPISGRALVTVEREGVSRAFVAEIGKEHPAVQVPILPGDAPNVYVSVLLMRGLEQSPRRIKEPEYRAGCVQLLVPKTDTKLAVEVRPERAAYQPGEEAIVQVAVTDEAHRPAPGAEVTLYAVDKGVLSLTGYQTPAIFKAFYHPRPLDVSTGLTLPDLMSEDPEDLNFSAEKGYAANKGYLVGGGGEDGQGDRLRQNFVACAYWNATLVTDAEGRVTARFPTPDSLTEYAVMAVVHEGGSAGDERAAGRFGTGQGEFKVNKPLMLEPALPRFGNVGDHLFLRAVVHNQSPVAGDAEVTLDLDDKAAVEGADGAQTGHAARQLHLAPGESKTVDIPVVFTHTGEAAWTWHARLSGEGPEKASYRDSVRSTLTVDHPTPRRSEVANVRVDGANADDLLAKINPELLEGEDGLIRVSLSTSRLGELGEGVDALLHYPYGCVEQTTSSLLPWLALKDFRDALPSLRHTPQQAEDAVARGVNRLVGMQTEGGGLAYWPDVTGRDPHPWGSAYGGLGLALAKKAGYYVSPTAFNKLCQYLSELLRSDKEAAHDTYHEHTETDRCLALYALALAGKGEPAYYEKFYGDRDKLSPEDRTLLALAIAEDKENKGNADMIRTLLQPGPRNTERPETWNEFASPSVVDGMRLLAWCHFQPQGKAVEDRVTHLLDDRNGPGDWETTQGNAWAVLALAAYARDVEKPVAAASGTVALGGRSQPWELKGRLATAACEFPLDAAAAGKEKLSLTVGGKGTRLYVQTRVESRPRGGAGVNTAQTNGKGGYIIRRQYEKLNDDGSRAPAEGLKVGDRVLVSLEVEAPDRASYVAVNDPLPAVLEAVNPDFKTSGAGGNAPPNAGFRWWVSDFRELRADRAVFFCDRLYAGHFQLQYLARVRAAGTATAPAAKIEEMYHPDHYAETASASLSSRALE